MQLHIVGHCVSNTPIYSKEMQCTSKRSGNTTNGVHRCPRETSSHGISRTECTNKVCQTKSDQLLARVDLVFILSCKRFGNSDALQEADHWQDNETSLDPSQKLCRCYGVVTFVGWKFRHLEIKENELFQWEYTLFYIKVLLIMKRMWESTCRLS